MKRTLLFFLCICNHGFAQTQIEGVVLDGGSNLKLAGASVFINNTSKGTTTNADGKFILNNLTETNFELVISYTGYVTYSLLVNVNNIQKIHTIKMYPRKQELQEVSVSAPEKDGWKHWGRLFTESFLGISDLADECSIENPKVLKFNYDTKTSRLKAYSNSPLIVTNKALGYIIRYQLEDFSYDFNNKITQYVGYTAFQNIQSGNNNKIKKWEKNRLQAYEGSMLHFMHALYADSVNAYGYVVREKIRVSSSDSIFNKLYNPGNQPKFATYNHKRYWIEPGEVSVFSKKPRYVDLVDTALYSFKNGITTDPVQKQKILYFENTLAVMYKNAIEGEDYLRKNLLPLGLKRNQTSSMALVSEDPIVIEESGLFFNPVNVITSGYWGWYKMAGTLPTDYVPGKK